MAYSNISYVMTQADIDAVKQALVTINSKMPFLISLSAEERKKLFKLGPKSTDFVYDCKDAVTNFPTIFPASFNITEFKKDAALVRVLTDLQLSIDSLAEKINDTLTAVGGEAMGESLDVYAYVQTATSGNVPGIKTVAEKLKERFKNQGKRKKPAEAEAI